MKKSSLLFLFLALTLQFIPETTPVFAQDQEADKSAIRQVLKTFYESTGKEDFNSALAQISPNFSCIINGQTMDYNEHKAYLKSTIEDTNNKFLHYIQDNIEVTYLDINGSKAVAVVDYDWKGFAAEGLVDKSGHRRRLIHLAKENGAWKITCMGPLVRRTQP